jgi:hypothetical protein
MPCGAAGKLLPLDKNHILPAILGKVISNRTAMDATADDNNLCLFWKRCWHQKNPSNMRDREIMCYLEPLPNIRVFAAK